MSQQTSDIVTPLSNRVYLFNYFERPQIKEDAFVKFWSDAADYIQTRDHFISTHLHHSIGKDDRFSWVNFAVFDSNDVCCFGKPDPAWGERMKNAAPYKLKAYPGQYDEIASYRGEKLTEDGKVRPDETKFLLTAIIAPDSVTNDSLEANWRSWMKADIVQQKLKDNPNAKDSLLYRMVKSRVPLVRYTVRTELGEMSDEEGAALADEINKQPDAAGIETSTACYKIHTNMFYKKE